MKGDNGQYTVDGLGNLQREGTWGETFGIQDISVKLNASFEPQVFITFPALQLIWPTSFHHALRVLPEQRQLLPKRASRASPT